MDTYAKYQRQVLPLGVQHLRKKIKLHKKLWKQGIMSKFENGTELLFDKIISGKPTLTL